MRTEKFFFTLEKVTRMILYTRTASGTKHALDPLSPLPRKMRSLLISIDGKTSRDTYVHNLSLFGDVSALLDSLELQGYITSVSTRNTGPDTRTSGMPRSAANAKVIERQGEPSSRPGLIDSTFASAGSANLELPLDQVSRWNPAQPNRSTSPSARSTPRTGEPSNGENYQLRIAIGLMSDFISSQLPDDSLEILLALEGIGSVQQAIASLDGYQAMIAPAGNAVSYHMAELRALLASH